MKIGYKSYDKTVVISSNDDIDVEELGSILYNICLSQGWQKQTLKDIFTRINRNRIKIRLGTNRIVY